MEKKGIITDSQLYEIQSNTEMQKKYKELMKASRDGGQRAMEALLELDSFTPEYKAGWFIYFQNFYERQWGLKLLEDKKD